PTTLARRPATRPVTTAPTPSMTRSARRAPEQPPPEQPPLERCGPGTHDGAGAELCPEALSRGSLISQYEALYERRRKLSRSMCPGSVESMKSTMIRATAAGASACG